MNFRKFLLVSIFSISFFMLASQASAAVSNLGLVGYWSMNEGTGSYAGDSSGNKNQGTLTNGPTWADGKRGKALNFDGGDDYVNTPYNFGKPTSVTLSLWFKTSVSPSEPMPIFGQANQQPLTTPTSYVPTFQINTAGTLRAEYWTGGTGAITTTAAVNNGTWHHVAFVGSGSNQQLFVDGVSIGARSGTINHDWWIYSTIGIGYSDTGRGASSNAWRYFNGLIDEVRVYNRVLSAVEVSALYKSGAAKILKPVAITETNLTSGGGAWGLSHTTASISPGANRLVLAIIHSGSFDLTQTTTLSGAGMTWVQVARVAATNNGILTVFRAMSATPGSGAVTITNSQNARSAWSFFELAGVDTSGTNGSGAIVQSVTSTGLSTTPLATLAPFSNTNNATVGGFGIANNNNEFTPSTGFSEIHEQLEGSGNNIHVATEWRADNDTIVDGTISSDDWLAFGAEIKAKPKATKFTAPPGNLGLVGYWSMNEGTGSYAGDASGNKNQGTLVNGPTWVDGKRGKALNFDGGDDYVNAGNPSSLTDLGPMTISLWAYPRSMGQTNRAILVAKRFTAGGAGTWQFQFVTGTDFCVAGDSPTQTIAFFRGNTTDTSRCGADNVINLNTWQHLVLTWDGSLTGTNIHMYKNGVEVSYESSSNGSGSTSDAATALTIGNRGDAARTFDGLIDEVRVYNRALSAAEIQALYKSGAARIGL